MLLYCPQGWLSLCFQRDYSTGYLSGHGLVSDMLFNRLYCFSNYIAPHVRTDSPSANYVVVVAVVLIEFFT